MNCLEETTLVLTKYDDETLSVEFFQLDGVTPENITGYTLFFTVKLRNEIDLDDTHAKIAKTITAHPKALQGIGEIPITSSDTENLDSSQKYLYDIKVKYPTGGTDVLRKGELILDWSATQRNS